MSDFAINFVVQLLSCVRLFATPWTAACQASLSFTISQSLLKFMSIESVMPSNRLILCCPLLLLPSIFPSIRVSLMSQLFASSGQSIGVSASSVLPMNIQGQFPSGLTGLISLQSKGLSGVFCNSTVQKHQFFGTTLISIHDYWETIALTIWTFVGKVIFLLFNTVSRFVIAFPPRSKHLLVSWMQSPSAVILEQKEIKSATVSPSI